MPLPGFKPVDHHSNNNSGYSTSAFVHNSGFLLLTRTQYSGVHGTIVGIGWNLIGPPYYGSDGSLVGGVPLYSVMDKYSNEELENKNLTDFFNGLPLSDMSEADRLDNLGQVVGTAVTVVGSSSRTGSRLYTALAAGLSDEDALHYVNGEEDKISKAGIRKLKKQKETTGGGVMIDMRLPGESDEEWEERTGRDLGDGGPY